MLNENHLLCGWFKKAFSVVLEIKKPPHVKDKKGFPTILSKHEEVYPMKDTNSLAHTTWNCKYHIVFAPKYGRQIIYGKYKVSIGQIIRELCERKGVKIIEANACRDHIHMLVSIPPKLSVSAFMGYLKGKSSLMIFDRHADLKYRYGNRKFWCRGYYVDTVGRNRQKIAQYIRDQLREDHIADQLTLFEEYDPFTGEKNSRKK